MKINGEEFCSNDQNQSGFDISDDTIKFNSVMDGVSSFEMVVDNENGGIQMNNIMVLHTGSIIKLLLKILIEARGTKKKFSESDSDAMQDTLLSGYTNKVFTTLKEAQDECHKLSERPESIFSKPEIHRNCTKI